MRISGVLTVPLRSDRRTARKRAFAPRTRRRRPSGSRTSAWCWSRFARARPRTTRAPRSPTRRPQTTSIAPAGAGPGEASPQRARPRRAQARRGTLQRRRVLRHFGAGPGAAGASRRTGRRSPQSTTKGGTATWAIYDSVQLVRRDGRDVSTLYGRGGGGRIQPCATERMPYARSPRSGPPPRRLGRPQSRPGLTGLRTLTFEQHLHLHTC